jgi:hypothetical protein
MTEPPKIYPELVQLRERFNYPEQLKRALEEAMMILAHTAERGIAVEPEVAQTLVRAKYLDQEQKWTPDDEAAFWTAYNRISQVIRPVTIDSIRATFDVLQEPNWFYRLFRVKTRRVTSPAQKAVRRYTWMGLAWVITMLSVQIYSLIGSTLMNNLTATDQKMQGLEKEIATLNVSGNESVMVQVEQKTTELDALSPGKNRSTCSFSKTNIIVWKNCAETGASPKTAASTRPKSTRSNE